jgi:short-subunit dehydrogenase
MKSLGGKQVLITGAAHGLGAALAKQFSDIGAQLILLDIDSEKLAELAEGIGAAHYQVDLSDESHLDSVLQKVKAEHGCPHVVVNNAALSVGGLFSATKKEDLAPILKINYQAAVTVTHFFLKESLERKQGHFVFVSSALAFFAMPRHVLYSGTKYALRGFAEALHAELHNTGVDVTVVHPGPFASGVDARSIYTEDGFQEKERAYLSQGPSPEQVASKVIRDIGKGRFQSLPSWQSHLLFQLRRLMPNWGHSLIRKYKDKLPA